MLGRLELRFRNHARTLSREEATARLPGDELLEDADGVATRAIEIDAPASAVWPWIAQIGPAPRGGAYTYDWVWAFVLDGRNGSTRLLGRNRFRLPTLAARLGMLPMEPASLVMERKMLRGIKERAERLAAA